MRTVSASKAAIGPIMTNVVPTESAAEPVLSVNNIEVIYDHVILVLKGVSLQVP